MDEIEERLDKLFDTITKNGFKINLKKYIFGAQELTYVSLKLTNKGIMPDSSEINAVSKAKVPRNVRSKKFFRCCDKGKSTNKCKK